MEKKEEPEVMRDYAEGDILLLDSRRDLAHLEEIWSGYNLIALCLEGHAQCEMQGVKMVIGKQDVILAPKDLAPTNLMCTPDFACKVLCLRDNILPNVLVDYVTIWDEALYMNLKQVIGLSLDSVDRIDHYNALMADILAQKSPSKPQQAILLSLLRALLLEVCCALRSEIHVNDLRLSQSKELFSRFLKLLAKTKVKHQNISYYSSELCVTPKYLSKVCLEYSSRTASDWIQQFVNNDIRNYLKYTNYSIKEVAFTLGFANISHFGEYCRRKLKKSPSALRAELKALK